MNQSLKLSVAVSVLFLVSFAPAEEPTKGRVDLVEFLGKGLESEEFISLKTRFELQMTEDNRSVRFTYNKRGNLKFKTIVKEQAYGAPDKKISIRFQSTTVEVRGKAVKSSAPKCFSLTWSRADNVESLFNLPGFGSSVRTIWGHTGQKIPLRGFQFFNSTPLVLSVSRLRFPFLCPRMARAAIS